MPPCERTDDRKGQDVTQPDDDMSGQPPEPPAPRMMQGRQLHRFREAGASELHEAERIAGQRVRLPPPAAQTVPLVK